MLYSTFLSSNNIFLLYSTIYNEYIQDYLLIEDKIVHRIVEIYYQLLQNEYRI
jgi:hypothetical protein